MDAVVRAESPTVGSWVTLIGTWNRQTLPLRAQVVVEEPLTLNLVDPAAEAVFAPSAAKIVWRSEEGTLLGEGTATQVERDSAGTKVVVKRVVWENLERRRHARYALTIPVALRAVTEAAGEVAIQVLHGTTADMSMGGCWISMHEEMPEEGSLVELHSSQGLRALSIVVRTSHERLGVGLAFVEFASGTRDLLFEMLNQAA